MPEEVLIEVCVDSVASATAAERGGARRIELCGDLLEGGITPSAGMIERVRAKVAIALHIMVRPRGGDFCYGADEFEVMGRDIETARKLGADGVVFGILDADGNVDGPRSRRLAELARPLSVTFHRAFDMSADLFRALEDVCRAGADRILTSGGQQTAVDGLDCIVGLVKAARERIAIMPGSGVRVENVRRIVEQSGVREVHTGMGTRMESPMRFRNPRISMGQEQGREYQRLIVLEENVRKLCRAASPAERPTTE
jgi:copper homeostasis protein